MVKFETMGMIKAAKSFPNIKAHADIANGYFCTIDFVNKATVAPTADTAKTKDVAVVMNTVNGDVQYTDVTIPSGEYVNCFTLAELANQNLQLDESHITYADTKSYADIVKGTTLLGIGTDGNLEVIADATGYGVYFTVLDKINFNGNGLLVKINVVDLVSAAV